LQLTSPAPPPNNPVARAHFRSAQSITAASDADRAEIQRATSHPTPADEDAIAAVVDVLRDAGVLTQQPRALLGTPKEQISRLALVDAFLQSGAAKEEELAFLANAL